LRQRNIQGPIAFILGKALRPSRRSGNGTPELKPMSTSRWTPGTVPYGADQTAYLIVDRRGRTGNIREIEIECADIEAVIDELMSGRLDAPQRAVAFNTLEHWSADISCEIAQEIQIRCDMAGEPIPEHISDFVDGLTLPTPLKTRLATTAGFAAPAG
jgi:hypothetical protein